MKQRAKIPIIAKKITKKDLKSFAEYLFGLKENDKDKFNMCITFTNKEEISSDDLSCLNSRKIEEYEIESIKIYYRNIDFTDEVDITIYSFDNYGVSNIDISSSNEEIYGRLEHDLTELLGFCNKQNKIISICRQSNTITTLIIVSLSVFALILILPILSNYFNDLLFPIIFFSMAMSTLYSYILKKIYELYPNIEFDISDKTNIAKKRRNVIRAFITAILFPLLVNLVYDIIKLNNIK